MTHRRLGTEASAHRCVVVTRARACSTTARTRRLADVHSSRALLPARRVGRAAWLWIESKFKGTTCAPWVHARNTAAAGLTLTDLRASASTIFRRVHDLYARARAGWRVPRFWRDRKEFACFANPIDRAWHWSNCRMCNAFKSVLRFLLDYSKRMKLVQYILYLVHVDFRLYNSVCIFELTLLLS